MSSPDPGLNSIDLSDSDNRPLVEWQWRAIVSGDYELLKRWESGHENYNDIHETYGFPLCRSIENYLFCGSQVLKPRYFACIRWLLERGASPLINCIPVLNYSISYRKRESESIEPTKRVEIAGKNALEIAMELRDSIPSSHAWSEERKRANEVIDLFSKFLDEERNPRSIPTIPVAEHVVAVWEDLFDNCRFHDIEIQCQPENSIVKSHECILRTISPFFDALIKQHAIPAPPTKGMDRIIRAITLSECNSEDLQDLLGLSMMGVWRTGEPPSLKRLCHLTILANRFLLRCSSLLNNKLCSSLSVGNFETLCEFALSSPCLENLKTRCLVLAAKSPEIEARFLNNSYSPRLKDFLKEIFSEIQKDEDTPKRKRSRVL